MRLGFGADGARRALDELITGLWSFSNAQGLLTDDINERTGGAGVTVDGLLIRDSGIPEAAVTVHEAALAILESQVVDGTLLARLAAAETVAGAWRFTQRIDGDDGIEFDALPLASTFAFLARVTGDTFARFTVDAEGDMTWGTGAGARDTNLFRDSANRLKTDDALTVALAFTAEHDFIVDESRLLLTTQGNNVNMVGETVLFVDSTGAQNISGIAGGVEGKIIAICNRDAADTITLLHASGSSSAGNRFVFPGDANHALASRESAILYYSSDADWRLLAVL